MVTYNPRNWFKLIVHFHKSDTFRILLPNMLVLGLLTITICYVFQHYLPAYHPSLTMFHQIAGFIISMVLVFRINTAYDRWWEGRKLWGSLVNVSRSLATRLAVLLPDSDLQKREEAHMLIAGFASVLKEHLRLSEPLAWNPELEVLEGINNLKHKPNYLIRRLDALCLDISKLKNGTSNDYLILSGLLAQMTDVCGACERIKSTPIPYSYSIFIKKIIFLYIITMPLAFGISLGYWSVPMVMILFYAFASLEIISEEIEDPFGTDSNDLPTDDIAAKIKENTREILFA